MGAAASLAADTEIGPTRAKELAGERWAEVEEKFNKACLESGYDRLPLSQMKVLVPELFFGVSVTLGNCQELAMARGVEWGDELNAKFEANATTTETENEAVKVDIPLALWKSLVPTLFETAEERANRLGEEFQALLRERAEGSVVINYQM
ncbi:hypothetical protein B484DRAFT_400088 [Ochromonadaceae sp. CCMP2298]|nr:hypothetical protein B484DRAFT_400088 [Ochromonadaceae sp. CCMP2298]